MRFFQFTWSSIFAAFEIVLFVLKSVYMLKFPYIYKTPYDIQNDSNPYWKREVEDQHRWSVPVYCGIVEEKIIGQFV